MKRKPAQRKKKVITRPMRKTLLRLGIIFVIFLASLLFLGAYSLYKYINQSYVSALSTSPKSIIEDTLPTVSYIVIEDFTSDPLVLKKVNYLVFDKDTKKVLLYDLPIDNNYKLPGKYGEETFSKMFALGGLNSNNPLDAGVELINRSITKLFGFKVDKFVLVSEENQELFDNLWREGGAVNLLKILTLTKSNNAYISNMTIKDLHSLVSLVDSIPRDRVVEYTSPLCYCDTQDADSLIREATVESEVSREKKDIAILNGTDSSGLAGFGARLTRNLGGRVIAIDNTEAFYDSSVIIADDTDCYTVEILSRVLRIDNIVSKSESYSFREGEIARSDVVVILGFDTLGDLY